MGKIIRLTERDLTRLVKRVINEEGDEQIISNNTEYPDRPSVREPSEWEKEYSKDKEVRMNKNEEIDKKIREPLKKYSKHENPETIIVRALILAKTGEESPSDLTKYLMTRFKKIEMRPYTHFNNFDDAEL